MNTLPPMDAAVKAVFEGYSPAAQAQLRALRRIIFDFAAADETIGPLEETLKWGQISYLTPVTRSGTTVRIDALPDDPDRLALYVNCRTTLVDTFRTLYGGTLEFEGHRCVKFSIQDQPQVDAIKHCIALTLTYHRHKHVQPVDVVPSPKRIDS